MDVEPPTEEEATAAAAAAWLSPELATAAPAEGPGQLRRRRGALLAVLHDRAAAAAPAAALAPIDGGARARFADSSGRAALTTGARGAARDTRRTSREDGPRNTQTTAEAHGPAAAETGRGPPQKLAEAVGDDAASYVHSFRRCGRCGKRLRCHEVCRGAPGPSAAGPGGHVFLFFLRIFVCVRRLRGRVQGGRRREERRHLVVEVCG